MNETLAIVWAGRPKRPSSAPKREQSSSHGQRPWLSYQSLRDLLLLLAGLAGLYHQFVVAPEAQEILVGAALALIFSPVPLRLDEIRRNGSNGS